MAKSSLKVPNIKVENDDDNDEKDDEQDDS